MKNEKRKVGRPTVMTEAVVAKLEEAFGNGATDNEACFVAGISKDSLYDYIKLNPEFSERKEALKDNLKYQAKMNIAKKLKEGDVIQANWYAERKMKDEFSPRNELTGANGNNLIPEISDEQFNRIIIARAKKLNN